MTRQMLRRVAAAMFVLTIFAGTGRARGEDAVSPREVSSAAAKDFPGLADMDGFSREMIEDHLALYRGYVRNADILRDRVRALSEEGKSNTPEYAELKRRLGWEVNGMLLHEYYFGNLGGDGRPDADSGLYMKIEEDFGSFERWKSDLLSTGAMRGIGWAVLYFDPAGERLMNVWVNEHDTGHIAGGKVILVMDVFEHAYMTDYRLDRAGYMEAFMNNIDWREAERRYELIR